MTISQRNKAIIQALFVTLLWSSSWVLIKLTIDEIPPLTFAGLRYSIAFIVLLPGLFMKRESVKKLSKQDWGKLLLLGLVYYAFTQGGQFLALKHLDAITLSLMLNFSAPLMAIIGLFVLNEPVSKTAMDRHRYLSTGGAGLFPPTNKPAKKHSWSCTWGFYRSLELGCFSDGALDQPGKKPRPDRRDRNQYGVRSGFIVGERIGFSGFAAIE